MDSIDFTEHDDLPIPLPSSTFYQTRHSPISGRGIFASKSITKGITLLTTDDSEARSSTAGRSSNVTAVQQPGRVSSAIRLSPIAHTILREYRKEVCAECFLYDRGREWKIKLETTPAGSKLGGVVFCSEQCRAAWVERYGTVGIAAFTALEEAIRKAARRSNAASTRSIPRQVQERPTTPRRIKSGPHEQTGSSQPSSEQDEAVLDQQKRPTIEVIKESWCTAAQKASTIATIRVKSTCSKAEKKLLRTVSEPDLVDSDLCYYLITGALNAYVSARLQDRVHRNINQDRAQSSCCGKVAHGSRGDEEQREDQFHVTTGRQWLQQAVDYSLATASKDQSGTQGKTGLAETPQTQDIIEPNSVVLPTQPATLLHHLLTLTPDSGCYAHPSSTLELYISSYLLLHAILPNELSSFLTAHLSHELNSRASHNAFSIRPSEFSDGDQSGEFMGWGVWPSASFFNHSCAPNVGKRRIGRNWEFYITGEYGQSTMTADDQVAPITCSVSADDELCITYLGGDERDLDVTERRKRLREGWGFECMCKRCIREDCIQTKETS